METEIKEQKVLWSEGFVTGKNKKPFFRIDILSNEVSDKNHNGKPFMIFLQGYDFNKEIYKYITEKKFGEYSSKIITDLNGFKFDNPEGYELCLDENGIVDEKRVPSMYKSYLYSVSNIDYILEKIIEVDTIVGKNIVKALEVIL